MIRFSMIACAVTVFTIPVSARAQVVFTENFDVDHTANWTANAFTPGIDLANFFFDYSTLGIPPAPGGTTTRGMRLQANVNPSATAGQVTGTFSGISASPNTSPVPAGATNYTLRFNAWQNAPGPFPAGGSGSTQMTGGGIGARTNVAQFAGGSVDGVFFNASGEGGTNPDYRAYNAAGAPIANTTPGVYAAGTQANSTDAADPYYSVFTGKTPPAAQTTLFPQQTGTTAVGSQAFAWHQWDITRAGNNVTWSIDGRLIATVDVTGRVFAGNNIFLAQSDINATTTTGADRELLFGLIDNVTLTINPVPEPGSFLLVGLAAPLLWRLRRRRS
jgi:hypothetical protein